MNQADWKNWRTATIGPACLGLVLALMPAARACDMEAVDEELARTAVADQMTPRLQAAAEPANVAADPSPNDDEPQTSSSPQKAPAPANSPAPGAAVAAPAKHASKPASPMGHTEGAETDGEK